MFSLTDYIISQKKNTKTKNIFNTNLKINLNEFISLFVQFYNGFL